MKKLATIFMLVGAMLLGGMTIDAKTTGSKSTTGKTARTHSQSGAFTIKCLMHKETAYGNTGLMFNSDSRIDAALKKAGFSLKSKKVTRGKIDVGTEGDTAPGKTIHFVYTKDGITVSWVSYAYDEAPNHTFKNAISIHFSNKAAKNAFMNSVTSNGYKNDGYGIYEDAADWIMIEVKGDYISLIGNWE